MAFAGNGRVVHAKEIAPAGVENSRAGTTIDAGDGAEAPQQSI
jgi:hypothetical protein